VRRVAGADRRAGRVDACNGHGPQRPAIQALATIRALSPQSGEALRAKGRLGGMHTVLHLAVLAATVLLLSRVLPDVRIRSGGTAVLVAVIFSLLNFFLGWFVRALLFVPALLTLGILFFFMSFIVNTVMLWLTDKLVASFEIRTRKGLLLSAAAITLVNAAFQGAALCHAAARAGYGGGTRGI
jgi:putative membrane protein